MKSKLKYKRRLECMEEQMGKDLQLGGGTGEVESEMQKV